MSGDWWETWTPKEDSYANYTPVGTTIEETIPYIPSVQAFPSTTPTFDTPSPYGGEGIAYYGDPNKGAQVVPVDFQNFDWVNINKIPDNVSQSQTVVNAIVNDRILTANAATITTLQGKASNVPPIQQAGTFGFENFAFLGLTGISAFLALWFLLNKK